MRQGLSSLLDERSAPRDPGRGGWQITLKPGDGRAAVEGTDPVNCRLGRCSRQCAVQPAAALAQSSVGNPEKVKASGNFKRGGGGVGQAELQCLPNIRHLPLDAIDPIGLAGGGPFRPRTLYKQLIPTLLTSAQFQMIPRPI